MPVDPNPPRAELVILGNVMCRHQSVDDNEGGAASTKALPIYGPIYIGNLYGVGQRGISFINAAGLTYAVFGFDGTIQLSGIVIDYSGTGISLADGEGVFFRNAVGTYVARLTPTGDLCTIKPVVADEEQEIEIAPGDVNLYDLSITYAFGPFPKIVLAGAVADYPILQVLNSGEETTCAIKVAQDGTISVRGGLFQGLEDTSAVVYGSIDFSRA